MNKILCWLKRGRPIVARERHDVHFLAEAPVHDMLLKVAGQCDCSITDAANAALAIGLAVLDSHPELRITLSGKFGSSAKK